VQSNRSWRRTGAKGIRLSQRQKEILKVVIWLHEIGEVVKSETIARMLGIAPSTLRNQIGVLRSLKLVESMTGPNGGYRPTAKAYEILNVSDGCRTPVFINGEVSELMAEEVSINLSKNIAKVKVLGDVTVVDYGVRILIGPSNRGIFVCGKVVGRDDFENLVLIDVEEVGQMNTSPSSTSFSEVISHSNKLLHES